MGDRTASEASNFSLHLTFPSSISFIVLFHQVAGLFSLNGSLGILQDFFSFKTFKLSSLETQADEVQCCKNTKPIIGSHNGFKKQHGSQWAVLGMAHTLQIFSLCPC